MAGRRSVCLPCVLPQVEESIMRQFMRLLGEGHPCSAETHPCSRLMVSTRSFSQRVTTATRHASFNGKNERHQLQPFGRWSQSGSPTTGMRHGISVLRLSGINGGAPCIGESIRVSTESGGHSLVGNHVPFTLPCSRSTHCGPKVVGGALQLVGAAPPSTSKASLVQRS